MAKNSELFINYFDHDQIKVLTAKDGYDYDVDSESYWFLNFHGIEIKNYLE